MQTAFYTCLKTGNFFMIEALTRHKKTKREAVFTRVFNEIKAAIDQGILAPGEPLPSENVLSAEYGISRSSVRSALNALESKSLIFKKPGKGTFVRDNSEPAAHGREVKLHNLAFEGFAPGFLSNFYSHLIYDSIIKTAEKRGIRVSSVSANQVPLLSEGMADSLITISATPEKYDIYRHLYHGGIYPLLFNRIVDIEGISYVAVDYAKASNKGMTQLLKKGHKSIGWVESSSGNNTFLQRYRGMHDAVNDWSSEIELLACSVEDLKSDEFYEEELYRFLYENKVTAIYLLNGCFAAPLFNACRRLDIRIPEDLEVLCFDRIEKLHYFYQVPFMYINMPVEEMATDATNHLVDRMEYGKSVPVLKKLYQAEVISVGY
jgi:GntR family transcriptional regulator, arabinose operon transcriptional repressor